MADRQASSYQLSYDLSSLPARDIEAFHEMEQDVLKKVPILSTSGEQRAQPEIIPVRFVNVEDGEVTLYWDLPAKDAAKLLKLLRVDLVNLEADEFFDKWLDADAEEF